MVDFLVPFDSTEFDAADSGGPMLPMVPVEAQAVQVNASLVEKEMRARQQIARRDSIRGKCGNGRHGNDVARAFLSYHMRMCKKLAHLDRMTQNFHDVVDHVYQYSVMKKRMIARFNQQKQLVGVRFAKTVNRGNRWKRRIPLAWYTLTAFSNLNLPGLSKCSVRRMRRVVAITVMGVQLTMLAKLCIYLQANKATTCVHRSKFDEASHTFRVTSVTKSARLMIQSADHPKSGRGVPVNRSERSVWSVLIHRSMLLLAWADGRIMMFKLVFILVDHVESPGT